MVALGNRGRCAQPCRMKYDLIEEKNNTNTVIDSNYILSPKDLCGLDFIPSLINAGVSCFKIEGRMKTPDYVATVTRIYRKYIDLALSGSNYIVDKQDRLELMQVFNRGGFSNGHLDSSANKDLIYSQKPNHMGLYLGKISKYNSTKGIITLTSNQELSIGDTLMVEKESSKYNVSELMIMDKNIKKADINQTIQIGRLKGNINVGDKVYKVASKELTNISSNTYSGKEFKKIPLNIDIIIKKDFPISLKISCLNNINSFYNDISIDIVSDIIPLDSINSPLTEDKVISQFSKTNDTPYTFTSFNISLDDNLFVQNGQLNEFRRTAILKLEETLLDMYKKNINFNTIVRNDEINTVKQINASKISLLLNNLNLNYDYLELKNVDNLYIPFKYFVTAKYSNILNTLVDKFNTYIYMPTIMKENYIKLFENNIEKILNSYDIKGFVVSNISYISMFKDYKEKYKLIGNYTLNVFNTATVEELNTYGLNTITLSPELSKNCLQELIAKNTSIDFEIIGYGKLPIMNMNYCLLGKSNKCYKDCSKYCNLSDNTYYLKDRLGLKFEVVPDNIETITTIYNSKVTSISNNEINASSIRIDILNEDINKINSIIECVKTGNRLEGNDYTNGNLNREV